jgi:hypothetical protein
LVVCGAPSAVLLRLEYFAVKNLPACTYVLICTMTTGDMFHTHPGVEQPQPLYSSVSAQAKYAPSV